MSEFGPSPEIKKPAERRVVMQDPEGLSTLGKVFDTDGLKVDLAQENSGLHALIDTGRTLITTTEGRFMIVKANIIHVDASARRGTYWLPL